MSYFTESKYVLLKTKSYIIRMNREDNLCWFHGKVSRDRAEQILREEGSGDGVFLVRDSNSSDGDYVLSVLHNGEIWHYQIRRHGEDAFFSIDDQQPIHGLDSLIEHYQNGSHGLVTQLSAIVKRDPPPHDSRSHGRTNLLHRATKEGDFVVVSELLKCGYRNIDAKNQDGQTAVHLACRFGNERMIEKLITSGANVNCRDTEGNTPLHYACRKQSATVVRLLIESKANIQARNNGTGCVPLHDAAGQGNLPAVKELIGLGAPYMPRSTYGELPIDYARDGGHKDVIDYFEKYNPPAANVYKYQWYHGTLSREESNITLRQFAKCIGSQDDRNHFNMSTDDLKSNQPSNYTSGVFLVRFSSKTSDYVLTLLFDDQPKHFIIQKYLKHLYIDDGPYMPSLEHLIEHYMNLSDGLPINLRYPVPPKPKPPLPLFSTIPKSLRSTKTSPISHSLGMGSGGSSSSSSSTNIPPPIGVKRNMSIPTDDLMNTIGILPETNNNNNNNKTPINSNDGGGGTKDKIDILNFRSLKLKSPKKNLIIDGMKSLKKNKSKFSQKKEDSSELSGETTTHSQLNEISSSLKNLTFSSDLRPVVNLDNNEFYNTPTNNSIVSSDFDFKNKNEIISTTTTPTNTITTDNNNEDNNINGNTTIVRVSVHQEPGEYFTQSDNSFYGTTKDKDSEEIYFIDAPTISKPISDDNNVPQLPPPQPPPITTQTTIGYTAFKHVPYFADNTSISTNTTADLTAIHKQLQQQQPQKPPQIPNKNNNNQHLTQLRFERLESSTSYASTDSDMSACIQLSMIQQPPEEWTTMNHHSNHPTNNDGGDGDLNNKPNYYIPKSHLRLQEILGEGEFGSVFRGAYIWPTTTSSSSSLSSANNNEQNDKEKKQQTENLIPVAIKTLHDEHCKQNRAEFLREASVMIRLSHHCIVKLIGISKGPPLMMVQELVALGSMLNYIVNNTDQVNVNFELKLWASQIACGMNYLESHHFVHRDLAARNILLASKHQAKISDFGLSRALCTENNYYQASQGGKWPIKWYAPESFNYGTFSHASDVWSFGVTLWEMFSFGLAPYGDMKGVDVIKIVEIGQRLSRPVKCPENVYQIMENCWNYNPKDRPTFRHLTQFFANDPDYQNLLELIKTQHIS